MFKLHQAIDRHGHLHDPAQVQQVAIYHDGVGTESLKWLRASGATGWRSMMAFPSSGIRGKQDLRRALGI